MSQIRALRQHLELPKFKALHNFALVQIAKQELDINVAKPAVVQYQALSLEDQPTFYIRSLRS